MAPLGASCSSKRIPGAVLGGLASAGWAAWRGTLIFDKEFYLSFSSPLLHFVSISQVQINSLCLIFNVLVAANASAST